MGAVGGRRRQGGAGPADAVARQQRAGEVRAPRAAARPPRARRRLEPAAAGGLAGLAGVGGLARLGGFAGLGGQRGPGVVAGLGGHFVTVLAGQGAGHVWMHDAYSLGSLAPAATTPDALLTMYLVYE